MDADLNKRLICELTMLEHVKKEYDTRLELLSDCEGSLLRRTVRSNGKHYYYIKRQGSHYRYLGSQNDPAVCRIQENRFLKEAIRRIDHDMALINALLEKYESFDPSSVSESLSETYRCEVPPVSELYVRKGAEWLARRLEFQKGFPENYPQRKRHRTSDGVMVKTISEVTLYEMFKGAGFAQIYELPLPLDDYGPPLYPDFTILSPVDMKTEIIVEYVGRLDRQDYREDFAKRLGRYIANGYKPGVDLFFVYSDKDGNIDSMQISKVIADIKGLRCPETAA